MATEKKERVAKTTKEKIAIIDAKIAGYQKQMDILNEKKEAILNPKPKLSTKLIIAKAKEAGMTSEEIAEKLGISL